MKDVVQLHIRLLFGDNDEFMKQFPYNSVKWEHLSYLIAQYTKMSEA